MFPTPTTIAYDNGPSNLDRRHIAFVNFIYEIPFLKNSSNRLLKSTVGGWQVSGVVRMVSGNSATRGRKRQPRRSIILATSPTSPNSKTGQNVNGSVNTPHTVNSWFGTSAFRLPGPDCSAISRQLCLWSGPPELEPRVLQELRVQRSRGSRLEFRAETFNTFNHTQFKDVSNTFSASNFGAVTTAHDPREIQLGFKLIF